VSVASRDWGCGSRLSGGCVAEAERCSVAWLNVVI